VFENKVLGRIFGLKRKEIIGGWKNCILGVSEFVIFTKN
jgi:hypothetical protein